MAAAKKDFSGVNTGRVYTALERSTASKGQQGEASPQEAAQRAKELRTQGRKGCKAVRINMAFSTDNYAFIKIMARISGKTMTEFANDVVSAYRAEHQTEYDSAREIIDKLGLDNQ